MTIPLVLAAGEEKVIALPQGAVFFYVLESTHEFFIVDYGNGSEIAGRAFGVESRDALGRPKVFTNLRIINSNAEEMTITYLTSFSRPIDARAGAGGGTNVLGDVAVINQPLTSEGGTITPLGASVGNYSGIAVNQTLVAIGANTNGIMVRTAVFQTTAAGSNTLNSSDGVTRRFFLNVKDGVSMLNREHYIPKDQSLEIHMSGGALNAWVTYDIL